jgi:hypothetical protein
MVIAVHVQGETQISQGTVNIGFANANGIVLLTDSVESSGGRALPDPTQKLFQLDEKTVCSIAGFASETGWVQSQLNTEVAGIVAAFKDELSRQPIPDLDTKLHALGILVGFYIDLVANRREVIVGPGTPDNYVFEVIAAGYDADGKAKIEKLVLNPVAVQDRDGHKYWSHTTSPEFPRVGEKFVSILGGIPDVSNEILNSPEKFSSSKIVRRYMSAKKHDGGASLTLDEMTALASYMAAQTHTRYPSLVGPPDQVAVLTGGKIAKLEQPHFANSPRPMKFALMVNLRIQRDLQFMTPPDTQLLWIRSEFVGFRNPRLRLDGQFFYGCEIRDSIVEYGGGFTDLGRTNTVVNSFIMPGYSPGGSEREMLRILNGFPTGENTKLFKWSDEPPNTPLLPPMVSARR